MNSQDSPPATSEAKTVPLRVRFYPLWGWYFVGSVLFAQTFLATRLWGGWNALALAQLVAFQIILLPRIILIAAGFSLGLTLLTSRLVSWIARPMARRWYLPMNVLPPASETTLYLRTGETAVQLIPARRRTDHLWEPGWLILTDHRLLWLSGMWRTVMWEIDARDPDRPITERVRPGHSPRWFGGYVTGAPPRVYVERDAGDAGDLRTEVLAMIDPATFLASLEPDESQALEYPEVAASDEPAVEPALDEIPQPMTAATVSDAGAIRGNRPELPPRRDYTAKRPKRTRTKDAAKPRVTPAPTILANGILLPPRRRFD